MKGTVKQLIQYRISRSKETFAEAKLLAKNDHWNAAANRLYYACYYAINALLIKNDLSFSSHNGVKVEFHKSFIKTGLFPKEYGKLFNRLFNLRQEGDYIDFQRFSRADIEPFFADVERFITLIEKKV